MTLDEKIYSMWQKGMTIDAIAAELDEDFDYIRRTINKSPKERPCRLCGKMFVVFKRAKYCHECREGGIPRDRNNLQPLEPTKAKKSIKSIDGVLAECREIQRRTGRYISYGDYMRMIGY